MRVDECVMMVPGIYAFCLLGESKITAWLGVSCGRRQALYALL